jgi:hypothetical protein
MDLEVKDHTRGKSPGTEDDVPVIMLPDEMQDWATRNEPMISRLSAAIKFKSAPLNEHALWDMIASMYSTDWTNAKATLNAAERQVNHLSLPENRPLGLIGAAMHSDETVAADRQLQQALADFTILNETLRAEVALNHLLLALVSHQATLHGSQQLSTQTARVSAEFGAVAGLEGDDHDAGNDFSSAARRKPAKTVEPAAEGSLTAAFRMLGKLFGREERKPAVKPKAPDNKF